jgi:hypothetical protein
MDKKTREDNVKGIYPHHTIFGGNVYFESYLLINHANYFENPRFWLKANRLLGACRSYPTSSPK